jgi:putative membrane protein
VVWRKLAVLPLARLQSFAAHQGPIDRMLRIATGRGHVVTGPVQTQVAAIDRDQALRLFDDVASAAVRAASGDRSHRWASDADGQLAWAQPQLADPQSAGPVVSLADSRPADGRMEPGS